MAQATNSDGRIDQLLQDYRSLTLQALADRLRQYEAADAVFILTSAQWAPDGIFCLSAGGSTANADPPPEWRTACVSAAKTSLPVSRQTKHGALIEHVVFVPVEAPDGRVVGIIALQRRQPFSMDDLDTYRLLGLSVSELVPEARRRPGEPGAAQREVKSLQTSADPQMRQTP